MSEDRRRLWGELEPDLAVVRELGSGSFARVLLARETALRRLVAVKVLRPELASDEVARLRFEREAQAAASIRHPAVIPIHRVGRLPSGPPFIVMEFIQGRTLEELLRVHGSIGPADALRILAHIADALSAAHRAGVAHRDLRPANVMIEDETERVMLMDFGIAALLETHAADPRRITATGIVLGNPSHVSPEQFAGERVTGQSDIYALGVIAHELLTGKGPFGPDVVSSASRTIAGDEPPELGGIGERPAVLLRRCLALHPGHRPTASELAAALGGESRDMGLRGPSAAEAPTRTDTSEVWNRRRLAAVWFADLVGFSALAAANEPAALAEVQSFQRACREAVRHCGGRVVKFTGDGAFAEFGSTEAAVEAALKLRTRFAADADAASTRLKLRIGIHAADVTPTADGDVLGDGVNVAARLEREAQPGEILVSGDVRRHLRSRPEWAFRSLGARTLRGIEEPVDVYSLESPSEDP